ncbi:MAG TPA: hypothetical protein VMB19_00450 [Silvibacterium sp.]|nr:hypothetical protein [Silvibacterium sp.]
MAEETNPVDFWKGFAMGSLVGLIAAAYARGDFKRLLSFAPCEAEIPEPAGAFREHDRTLTMRREAPENAGDPTRLSPSLGTPSARLTIRRPSGNPGPDSRAEVLEVPGQPGRPFGHSDSAQHVESGLRTQNLSANAR